MVRILARQTSLWMTKAPSVSPVPVRQPASAQAHLAARLQVSLELLACANVCTCKLTRHHKMFPIPGLFPVLSRIARHESARVLAETA